MSKTDNSFASIEGLCESTEKDRSAAENNIHCVILFDNEEVRDHERDDVQR